MLGRRLVGIALRSNVFASLSAVRAATRPTFRYHPASRVEVCFSSTAANNAEKGGENNNAEKSGENINAENRGETSEAPKFQLRKADGKRLTGAEFFDVVKEAVAKEQGEEFVVPTAAFEALLCEYDAIMKEDSEYKDKYQRSLAETENVRHRGFKLVEEAKVFAIQSFCKDLLEVADVLDIAVDSVKPEQLKTADKTLSDLHQGIVMTRTVLLKTFAKHGLVPVNPMGEKFDPNVHEAVFQVPAGPDVKAKPGHIMHVSKIGYSLKERPVRAAQVGVVVDS